MSASAQRVSQPELPLVIPFPTLSKAADDLDFKPDEVITVRSYWTRRVLPELEKRVKDREMSERSIKEDRHAINAWEKSTFNPDIREVTPTVLEQFKDGQLDLQIAPPTINKRWRELKAIFAFAEYDKLIPRVPQIAHRKRARLLKEAPKRQRESVTDPEVELLWKQCREASYPIKGQFPAPMLWRVWLVLVHTYGPRPIDLKKLSWPDIRWNDRLIQFEATKTGKLQGLPMTDLVARHLRSIKGHSEKVFSNFKSTGCFLQKTQSWKPGYYATWRSEISLGLAPEITFKHFRETMVTRYNRIQKDLGGWIAGHFIPGVTAQNYDLPTAAIREAIESAPVPRCFAEVA